MASACEFNSRVVSTVVPINTSVGIAYEGLVAFDTDPISTLQDQKPPVWDGAWSGVDFLEVFSGDFGGLERCFAVVHSRIDGGIWVWEITDASRFDENDSGTEVRIPMVFETPAFDYSEYPAALGGGPFALKQLDGLDLWLDRVFGEAIIKVEFRPDETACWFFWNEQVICAARNCSENPTTPACYPITPLSEQYRMPLSLPKPNNPDCQPGNKRPVTQGYKFQLRITITGFARVRGYQLHCLGRDSSPFSNLVCKVL